MWQVMVNTIQTSKQRIHCCHEITFLYYITGYEHELQHINKSLKGKLGLLNNQ
jgi:hypothetical protein